MLGRGQKRAGFGHSDFLQLRQQLDFAYFVVRGFGQIDALACFLGGLFRRFHGLFGDVDLRSIGLGLGQLRGGQLAVRLGTVAGLGRLLGLAERHGFLLLQIGKPRVFLLGEEQVRRRGFQSGLGLLDPVVDLFLRERQASLSAGFIRLRGGKGPAGDLDLKGDFQPQPGQCRLLPLELRFRRLDFASSQVDLVAIGLRVDFRQHLVLFDPVILLDEEGDEMARHGLRGHVDDVGLHKGVLGDRAVSTIRPPGEEQNQGQGNRAAASPSTSAEGNALVVRSPAAGIAGAGLSALAGRWIAAARGPIARAERSRSRGLLQSRTCSEIRN